MRFVKEKNQYASWLIMSSYSRKLTKVELRDWLLLATFYQQRARANTGKLAVADKHEVFRGAYWPNRAQGRRKDTYALFGQLIDKAKKLGYVEEPQEGWLDITDKGKAMLRSKLRACKETEVRAIHFLASRWTPNTTRHNQFFTEQISSLEKE
jgi:hypothetical protein